MPPLLVELAQSGGENAFASRLRRLTRLDASDVNAFTAIARDRLALQVERVPFSEGDEPRRLHVLVEGWAARVKLLPDGRRHFCTLLLPGDICDGNGLHARAYDYGVVALTPCTLAVADRQAVRALCAERPQWADVLAWFAALDNSMLNEAALSLARRSAHQRLAHLLCELRIRLDVIGRFLNGGYDLPLTHDRLADALGLTPVHVGRSLKQLRWQDLVVVNDRRVTSANWSKLCREAQFSPAYLHLDGMRQA